MANTQAPSIPPFPGVVHVSDCFSNEDATALVNACVEGDLGRVQTFFKSLRANQPSGDLELYSYWPMLLAAVAHDRPDIVSYSLDQGLQLGPMCIEQAIRTKSIAIFDVLLRHGWEINQQLSELTPSALA